MKALKLLAGPIPAVWLIFKVTAYLVTVVLFVASLYVILQIHEIRLLTEFQALKRVDPLPEARRLVAAGAYCDALEYLDYFREYDYVKQNPEIAKYYNKIRELRQSYWFIGKGVLEGVWKGKGACLESMLSATAADFFLVGDIRDLIWQGIKTYQGEETDNFVAALSGLGIVLTGATYATAGGATPAKGSVSLLKLAKRLNKIPEPLQKNLIRIFKKCTELKSLRPLEPVASSLYALSKTPGMKIGDMMTVLSRCNKVGDLKFMEKVALAYGGQTGKFLKLGGETPVTVLKKYGKSGVLKEAVDRSLEYGKSGTRLLGRTGPDKFMTYLKMAKYGVRGTRTVWQGRMQLAMTRLLKMFPEWTVFVLAGCTGLVTVAVPVRRTVKWWRRRRPGMG